MRKLVIPWDSGLRFYPEIGVDGQKSFPGPATDMYGASSNTCQTGQWEASVIHILAHNPNCGACLPTTLPSLVCIHNVCFLLFLACPLGLNCFCPTGTWVHACTCPIDLRLLYLLHLGLGREIASVSLAIATPRELIYS